MTDYADWQEPQAHATAISTTGVPLLTGSTLLFQQLSHVIGGHGTTGSLFLPVTQIGYDFAISVNVSAAATEPFVLVNMKWFDSVTGISTGSDSFICPGADGSTSWLTIGAGPTKGDQCIITITNQDGNNTTVSYTLLENSRVYARDDWHWVNIDDEILTIPGWTVAGLVPDESVLGVLSGATVAASTTDTWLLGMSSTGPVNVVGNVSGVAASAVVINLLAAPASYYGGGADLQHFTPTAAGFMFSYMPPRGPVALQVSNTATTGTLTFNLMAVRDTA